MSEVFAGGPGPRARRCAERIIADLLIFLTMGLACCYAIVDEAIKLCMRKRTVDSSSMAASCEAREKKNASLQGKRLNPPALGAGDIPGSNPGCSTILEVSYGATTELDSSRQLADSRSPGGGTNTERWKPRRDSNTRHAG